MSIADMSDKQSFQESHTFEYLRQEIETRTKVKGITPIDMLGLPAPLGDIFDKIMRRGLMTVEEMSGELDLAHEEADQLARLLVDKGYLRPIDGVTGKEYAYQIRFAIKRKRRLPRNIWDSLGDEEANT